RRRAAEDGRCGRCFDPPPPCAGRPPRCRLRALLEARFPGAPAERSRRSFAARPRARPCSLALQCPDRRRLRPAGPPRGLLGAPVRPPVRPRGPLAALAAIASRGHEAARFDRHRALGAARLGADVDRDLRGAAPRRPEPPRVVPRAEAPRCRVAGARFAARPRAAARRAPHRLARFPPVARGRGRGAALGARHGEPGDEPASPARPGGSLGSGRRRGLSDRLDVRLREGEEGALLRRSPRAGGAPRFPCDPPIPSPVGASPLRGDRVRSAARRHVARRQPGDLGAYLVLPLLAGVRALPAASRRARLWLAVALGLGLYALLATQTLAALAALAAGLLVFGTLTLRR